MARPTHTYRSARRNAWRSHHGKIPWMALRIEGHGWDTSFDDRRIIDRPHLARGWDYSKGGREKFNSVRDQYLGVKKQYRRLMKGKPL